MSTATPPEEFTEAGEGPAAGTASSPTAASVAAGLAEPGLDLRTARGVVELRARRRLRRRRTLVGAVAVVAVLAAVATVLRRDETREVVADADEPSTTTTAPTTSTSSPPVSTAPVTVPVTEAPSTIDVPTPQTTAPPPPPPPTVPPNRPLEATLRGPASVPPGVTARFEVSWSDPDFADPAGPRLVVNWGDRTVSVPPPPPAGGPCGFPGPGSGGSRTLAFRFAAPGVHTVRVEVSGCGGQGAYGESRTVEASITVTPGPALVVATPPGRPPAGARVEIVRGDGTVQTVEEQVPDLGAVLAEAPTRPAVVLPLAVGAGTGSADDGESLRAGDALWFTWPDGVTCRAPVAERVVGMPPVLTCDPQSPPTAAPSGSATAP